jgi:hypothetical protein
VKSNSLSSMSVGNITNGKQATVYTKASIYRINVNGSVTSIEGNVTLRMDVNDMTTDASDAIGFTVLSTKDSSLFYSNDWVYELATQTWKTKVQVLLSGLIAIGG